MDNGRDLLCGATQSTQHFEINSIREKESVMSIHTYINRIVLAVELSYNIVN